MTRRTSRPNGRRRRTWLAALAALLLLGREADATWSIVIVDTATGEVAVAGATCLAGFDLLSGLPVVRAGVGGAAAQSLIDSTGGNRLKIWNGLAAGDTPQAILELLAATDTNHASRQYGIVDMQDDPVKFTGSAAGKAKKAVVGTVGSLRYAIQGNVLTGTEVILAAEEALLAKDGDLGEKVLAGMLAARALGGDGRCSCDVNFPTQCGVPPPGFVKSAEVAFFVLARIGDSDGVCDSTAGCANGDYYLSLNVTFSPASKDPVNLLRTKYIAWRTALAGFPDHLLSTVQADADALVADGVSSTDVLVRLADVEGVPVVPSGGHLVTVTPLAGSTGDLAASAVVDHGDGSFGFSVSAGDAPGEATFVVRYEDGSEVVTLYPYLTVRADPVQPLHVGVDALSAAAGGSAPFTVHGAPNAPYLILGSLSGTAPGLDLAEGHLPLNPDSFFQFTLTNPGHGLLPGTLGATDASGRAEASFSASPGLLTDLTGARVDWSALLLDPGAPGGLVLAPGVGFDVLP